MSDFSAHHGLSSRQSRSALQPWTLFFVLSSLFAAGTAEAASPPKGTGTGVDAASSGSDSIAGEGSFATVAEAPEDTAACEDATDLSLSAGGLFSTGNANSLAVTGRGDFRLRRNIHQFSTIVLGNYAAGIVDEDEGLETVVRNFQGQFRYDIFFAERWSAFAMATARNDTFQGLGVRLNIDPGAAFYILDKADHQFWVELGYDYRFELQTREFIAQNNDVGDTKVDDIKPADFLLHDHAGRLFVGYNNQLHETIGFTTGLEYTQSFVRPEAFRINFDAGVNAQVAKKLSFAITFQLRYNHEIPTEEDQEAANAAAALEAAMNGDDKFEAPPIFRRLDTMTSFNVVYKF